MDGVTTHTIAFKGFSGATFVLVMVALNFYVLAFSTGAWIGLEVDGIWSGTGLWSVCVETENSESTPGKLYALLSVTWHKQYIEINVNGLFFFSFCLQRHRHLSYF